jgi:hypothetical protein
MSDTHTLFICILVACILFAGDPDLMDAIIKRVMEAK